MKSFVAGIVGAVVTGLLLFFAQDWWSRGQADAKQRISFDKQSDISISREELVAVAKKGNEYQTPSIQVFEAENRGTGDISDKSFSVATSDVLGFANISLPNGNPKNANITYDGKVLTVRYRLLPSGAKHSFWIASNSSPVFPEFANDSTGIHVVTPIEKIRDDQVPFPWGWFGAISACLVSLLLGAGINEAYISKRLSTRGHDFKDLMGLGETVPQKPV